MEILIVGKGESIKQIDIDRVQIPIMSVNYSCDKYDYIIAYDFDAATLPHGIYVKDFKLQGEPCFNKRKKKTLGFYNFTVTAAVNWCYKNGYNKIYLAGIDHDHDWYADDGVKLFLEKFVGKCEIYQCNQSSTWDMPKTKRFNYSE